MRRAFEHPLAPALGCAVLCVVYLIAHPATADMAAHSYRAWLFQHEGLTVWNAQWYGGHHVLGYSLLFAPLAAQAGPALVGVGSAVLAVAAFVPLARGAAPSPTAGAVASWLFAAGVLSNLAIGRMPFLLGVALAIAAWWCESRRGGIGWRVASVLLALGAMWASPVAGAFLLLGAAATLLAGGRAALGTAARLALPALAGGFALWLLFPEGGTDRFTATAFWPMLALSAGAVALLAPRRRVIWAAGMLYLLVLVGAFFVPSPFGQNALRLGVLAGPSVLALAHRRRVPLAALAVVGVGLLYLQWLPAVRAVAEAHGDPSTKASFQAEARNFLDKVAQPGERVEVPLTRNHWEAADLAKVVPLARGWERQLDQKSNPIFYSGRKLTPASYHAWLRENAVRWVALPNAPLDYSAVQEAKVLDRGAKYLKPVYSSARWRIWEVRDTDPPASGGAKVIGAGPTWFEVDAHKPTVVRQRYTRYWFTRGACVREAPGGWTEVDPGGSGVVLVQARFDIDRRANPACKQQQAAAGG
ncbi:hypothetical protein [Candidatus Solirubrobacter pratensis]|uniref:hypothetical protein n=1 Tax=Candidatus Solirubrobacter pratensis TaxID=1298857 RepID=UPI00040E70F0|nr:hypothetical protein [Candidatus Solirubrobacter pratensis]